MLSNIPDISSGSQHGHPGLRIPGAWSLSDNLCIIEELLLSSSKEEEKFNIFSILVRCFKAVPEEAVGVGIGKGSEGEGVKELLVDGGEDMFFLALGKVDSSFAIIIIQKVYAGLSYCSYLLYWYPHLPHLSLVHLSLQDLPMVENLHRWEVAHSHFLNTVAMT